MSSFKNREKGSERRYQAYEYLVANGLKPHLAAGVVGNLMQESFGHLDPTAIGDDGQSVGIAQWNGQRLVNLKRYAKNNKTSYKDFETQLGFLQQEINTTYDQGSSSWNKKQQANFFRADNAESAAEAFMLNFERPSKGEVNSRKKYATKLYLEANDSNIYSQNSKGDIVSVDPTTASQEVLQNSPSLQRQLYNTEFNKLSSEFKALTEANRATEAKIKGYNESEELQRAKNEIKNKYNEELFMESLTYGNNNSIQTGGPIASVAEDNVTEEAAQPAAAVETTGKNDLLAQAFKAPEQTPVQQQAPQQQGPDMYPGLETSDNEYYAAYLPEGFGDGGTVAPPSKTSAMSTGKDFVTNWMAHPETRKRYRENMSGEPTTSKTNLGVDNEVFRKALSDLAGTTSEVKNPIRGTTGRYQDNNIEYFGDPTVGTATHENTHAAGDISNNLSKFLMKDFGILSSLRDKYPGATTKEAAANEFGKDNAQGAINQAAYMGQNGELYPRIMEMRQFLNVTPGQQIDDEMINRLMQDKKISKTAKYYKPEVLKEMLNTVADTNQNSGVNIAEDGGETDPIKEKPITKGKEGYTKPPTKEVSRKGFLDGLYDGLNQFIPNSKNLDEVDGVSGADIGIIDKPITQREDFKSTPLFSKAAAGDWRTEDGNLRDLYRYYGGLPLTDNTIGYSQYKPTNSKDNNVKYINIKSNKFKQQVIEHYKRLFIDKTPRKEATDHYIGNGADNKINDHTYSVSGYKIPGKEESGMIENEGAIGRYFVSKGEDKNGKYLSYYDVFDSGQPGKFELGHKLGIAKPFEIYDRIYEKDFDSIQKLKDKKINYQKKR